MEPRWCVSKQTGLKRRDVGSNPALGAIFPIFITPHDIGRGDQDHVQAMRCVVVVVEPTCALSLVYIYIY